MKVKFVEAKQNPEYKSLDHQSIYLPQYIKVQYEGIIQQYISGDRNSPCPSYAIVLVGDKLLTIPTHDLTVIEE